MAVFNPQFKINQMAKDMGLKSKELTDVLSAKGVADVKTQKALTEREFSLLLQSLTEANQVDNINDYMDGITRIPSKKAAEKAAAAKAAAEKAAAEKAAAEKAAAEKAAAEKAAAEKAAAEKAAAEKAAAEKAAAEKAAAEKAAAEKAAAEKAAAEKAAAEKAAAERAAAKAAAERAAIERTAKALAAQRQAAAATNNANKPGDRRPAGNTPAQGRGTDVRSSQDRPAPRSNDGSRAPAPSGRVAADGRSADGRGSDGYFWSSTRGDGNCMYLRADTAYICPADLNYRDTGLTFRPASSISKVPLRSPRGLSGALPLPLASGTPAGLPFEKGILHLA